MDLAVYGNGLAVIMTSSLMFNASQNVTFTGRKFVYVLKITVVYHFLFKEYPWYMNKNIYHGCYCMDIPLVERYNVCN